jgi:hypothetical protein
MSDTATEEPKKGDPGFNDRMRRDKLVRQITRSHEWRVQVWAQMEKKIKAANAALEAMGGDPIEPFEPRFDDPEALEHYATMNLSK